MHLWRSEIWADLNFPQFYLRIWGE
jgi:hypothetical protein